MIEEIRTSRTDPNFDSLASGAEEAISHNLDLLTDAIAEFGQNGTDVLRQGAEAMDVTIRCYLLGQAIAEALDELSEELEEEDNEN